MLTFGEEIKRLRELKGLSQALLAESIGLKQGFISHIEKGRRQGLADVRQFFRLADALGVTTEHFRPFILNVPEEKPAPPAKKPTARKPRTK